MKIGVIGSGIAGLASAYWLSQEPGVHVSLLEKHDRIGMDAHRQELQLAGQAVSVDVPSRMFNVSLWPQLIALYDQLGVRYEAVDAAQSFSQFSLDGAVDAKAFLRLDVAFRPELALGQMVRSKSRKIITEAGRLMNAGRDDLDDGLDESQTLDQYLSEKGYSSSFRHDFLYPTLSSTVCTCSYHALDDYPAWIVLTALKGLTDDRDLMRTSAGTQDAVARLSSSLVDVRTHYAVSSIVPQQQRIHVASDNGTSEDFDHVIVATQANTARSLLPQISAREADVLTAIPYENVPVIVHRDDRLMPTKRADWATFNMGVIDGDDPSSAMCNVWLNRFYGWPDRPNVFQTIAPLFEPEPSAVLAKVRLQRPVVNAQSMRALTLLEQIHSEPERRIWFCGSWAAPGIPLLETGVASAQRVVNAITKSESPTV